MFSIVGSAHLTWSDQLHLKAWNSVTCFQKLCVSLWGDVKSETSPYPHQVSLLSLQERTANLESSSSNSCIQTEGQSRDLEWLRPRSHHLQIQRQILGVVLRLVQQHWRKQGCLPFRGTVSRSHVKKCWHTNVWRFEWLDTHRMKSNTNAADSPLRTDVMPFQSTLR